SSTSCRTASGRGTPYRPRCSDSRSSARTTTSTGISTCGSGRKIQRGCLRITIPWFGARRAESWLGRHRVAPVVIRRRTHLTRTPAPLHYWATFQVRYPVTQDKVSLREFIELG